MPRILTAVTAARGCQTTHYHSFGVTGVGERAGGKGILPERDNDRSGLGYYYVDLSEDLPKPLGLDSEQGSELFYNGAVTPPATIMPDNQYIIDFGGGTHDDALVAGIRMQMSF
ncbi:MAG: carbohydrate porin [Phycisphaerales bacterium]|nr:MAG: carbohydrate porin [Phycisphaerales bacterium]